ncbi:MAG: SDR family oxidoreductase [Eubacteriales bacterium]|nr:SDR family oxidoreductase [Eubacteriales bacterium]
MVALISGANKGIGFATANLFLSKGYKVVITGRNEKKLLEAKERLGNNVEYLIWDIADIPSAKFVIKKAHSIFGNISVFINNAGIVCSEDNGTDAVGFFDKTEAGWDETMNINLKGMFFALQAEAEYMRDMKIEGNIVNMCSEMGFRPALFPYGISKWGVRGMTMGAGKELAGYGIVVNGLAPGETATEILHQEEGVVKKICSPRGIQATPEEIAESVYFLSQSRNIIGEVLVSDGGRRLF